MMQKNQNGKENSLHAYVARKILQMLQELKESLEKLGTQPTQHAPTPSFMYGFGCSSAIKSWQQEFSPKSNYLAARQPRPLTFNHQPLKPSHMRASSPSSVSNVRLAVTVCRRG